MAAEKVNRRRGDAVGRCDEKCRLFLLHLRFNARLGDEGDCRVMLAIEVSLVVCLLGRPAIYRRSVLHVEMDRSNDRGRQARTLTDKGVGYGPEMAQP